MPDFTWDPDALRYRDRRRGRYVPETAVRDAVDAYAIAIEERMMEAARKQTDGRIKLDTFRRTMQAYIKDATLAGTMIAVGGEDRLTDAYRRAAEGRNAFEFGHLRDFIREIEAGTLSPDQIVARAAMYAGTATKTYEAARGGLMFEAGYTQHRRRLATSGSHCLDCYAHADRGWVAFDDPEPLPDIGEKCDCKSNCRCRKEYRMRRR